MSENVVFSRKGSVAERIEREMQDCSVSCDAALYRLNNPRLAEALAEAGQRGVRMRLVVDRGKYGEDAATRRLLAGSGIPFRVAHGRSGPRSPRSKMHHKFAILDHRTVLAGSYNWTMESEEENYENLLVLRDPDSVREFQEEFEALWKEAEKAG